MRSLSTADYIYCHSNIIHHAVESARHKNKVEIYKTSFEPVKNVNFMVVFINPINCTTLESIGCHKTYNVRSVWIKEDTQKFHVCIHRET